MWPVLEFRVCFHGMAEMSGAAASLRGDKGGEDFRAVFTALTPEEQSESPRQRFRTVSLKTQAVEAL
jgi:hypothetical protein